MLELSSQTSQQRRRQDPTPRLLGRCREEVVPQGRWRRCTRRAGVAPRSCSCGLASAGGAVRLAQNTGDGTGAGRDSSDSTGSCRDGGINGNVVDRAQGAKGARGRLRRSLGASSAVDR